MLKIDDSLSIDEDDLVWNFVRASGPGGQNVNKVATAAELRFDVARAGFPEDMKVRLKRLAGRQMTLEGILVIESQASRSQERNRQTAIAKLLALLREAAVRPKRRIATRPTRAAKARRLDAKARHARTKRLRSSRPGMD